MRAWATNTENVRVALYRTTVLHLHFRISALLKERKVRSVGRDMFKTKDRAIRNMQSSQ